MEEKKTGEKEKRGKKKKEKTSKAGSFNIWCDLLSGQIDNCGREFVVGFLRLPGWAQHRVYNLYISEVSNTTITVQVQMPHVRYIKSVTVWPLTSIICSFGYAAGMRENNKDTGKGIVKFYQGTGEYLI